MRKRLTTQVLAIFRAFDSCEDYSGHFKMVTTRDEGIEKSKQVKAVKGVQCRFHYFIYLLFHSLAPLFPCSLGPLVPAFQCPGSLQQSPAAGGSFAPASSTTFQVPSACLRHMVM